MQDPDKIVHAIAAHAKWKFRLREAIETGTSEWTVNEVQKDDRCDFGMWLQALPADERKSEHWETVRQLHAQFHKEAAEVLRLALAGRRQEAEAAIAQGSQFAKTTTKLTITMTAWRNDGI